MILVNEALRCFFFFTKFEVKSEKLNFGLFVVVVVVFFFFAEKSLIYKN